MSEHVLVTGGAGFIGTALIDHLNTNGYTTSSFDHHEQPAANGHSVATDLLTPSAFEIELEWLNGKLKVDRVIHLAAQVGRLFGEENLRHSIRSNAEMTTIVASTTAKMGIPMVYTSTSEIYGDQAHAMCHEDDGPFDLPHNLYGLSKRWGEEACRLYNPRGLIIWRPSMPYGPGAPPGRGRRALDNMLWQAYHRMTIPVHIGAERSWCWIGDTVDAMLRTIEYSHKHDNPIAYNIGRDDDPRSMLEIAQRACEMADAPLSLIKEIEAPGKQTVIKRLSTEKIRGLGWEPTVDLEDGLARVYDWIKHFDANGHKIS